MEEKNITKRRPHSTSKYYLKYGMTLAEIARRFEVTTTTICNWLDDSRKREWLENELKEEKE